MFPESSDGARHSAIRSPDTSAFRTEPQARPRGLAQGWAAQLGLGFFRNERKVYLIQTLVN